MTALRQGSWQNILSRAGWAALWGFTGAIPVAQLTAAFADGSISTLQQLAAAGVGGGMGALLSFFKTLAQEKMGVTS